MSEEGKRLEIAHVENAAGRLHIEVKYDGRTYKTEHHTLHFYKARTNPMFGNADDVVVTLLSELRPKESDWVKLGLFEEAIKAHLDEWLK